MKGNIKKLAVLVTIAAIAMFTAAALASGHDHERNAIHGEYAMVGVGSCLVSTSPFVDWMPTSSYSTQDTLTGIWTFKHNGTGTAQITQLKLYVPPYASPRAVSQSINLDFNYTVEEDGTITGAIVPETYNSTFVTGPASLLTPTPVTLKIDQLKFSGMVSEDHKTIILASGNEPMKVEAFRGDTKINTAYTICNTVRTLIRLGEIEGKGKKH